MYLRNLFIRDVARILCYDVCLKRSFKILFIIVKNNIFYQFFIIGSKFIKNILFKIKIYIKTVILNI